MGFFKKLFRKKKGGTFFGNLFRGAANKLTGGILGSGRQLAKNDAKIEQREYQAELNRLKAQAKRQATKDFQASKAYQLGSSVASPFKGNVDKLSKNSEGAKAFQNQQVGAWLKRNWWKIALPFTAIIGAVVYFARKSGTKSKRLS